jgi:phospholipid/cholesterol/gamma-HCH transport system ATP-binding protein
MKKRVGLARAIVYRPQYVLYDEPTTGLDPIMADTINQLILEMNGKLSVTSVVVTHDIVSACKVSNRIVMLHYGEIIYSGTPEEIKKTEHPTVKQFIEGTADGPIKPIHRDHIRI